MLVDLDRIENKKHGARALFKRNNFTRDKSRPRPFEDNIYTNILD